MTLEENSPKNDFESKGQNPVKINPMSEIGREIREAREKQQLSIKFLAESLKIGEEQLIALEEGDASLLPEKVFIKGMISRVSERLGLNSGMLIEKLNISTSQLSQELKKESNQKSKSKNKRNNVLFSLILLSSISLISTFILQQNKDREKIELSDNQLIEKIQFSKEITISSIKPTKARIINGLGETLFDGVIDIPLKYSVDNGLELYTYRPDLIEIEAEGMINTVLGSKEDVKWHDLSLILNQ